MAASPAELFARLDGLGIAHSTVSHRPVFTVDEGADLKAHMPGGHTKNLFLKDKKGALALVSAIAESKIDLNALAKALGMGRPSFGSAELLYQTLGVTPGSVTVFAVINAPPGQIRLVLDEALFAHEIVNFHPLSNDATTALAPADVVKFVRACGHAPVRIAFDHGGQPAMIEP